MATATSTCCTCERCSPIRRLLRIAGIVEPAERPVRSLALVVLRAGTVGFWQAPTRTRGVIALVVGHVVPWVRAGQITPASETAALNLGGGALLLTLGTALLGRSRARR